MSSRAFRLGLLGLLGLLLLASCTLRRPPSEEDDDDAADDDDSGSADDDDSGPVDDDDVADDDDSGSADDDDATADPKEACREQVLDLVQQSGFLPAETVLGDLPAQAIYDCETYQLLGVTVLASVPGSTAQPVDGGWALQGQPDISVNDAGSPATLSLTGCAPYSCGLWTNAMSATIDVRLDLIPSVNASSQDYFDLVFTELSHDLLGQIQGDLILTDCSVGNLNEDLQANGVDIFEVLVAELGPQITLAIWDHLAAVEASAEALSADWCQ